MSTNFQPSTGTESFALHPGPHKDLAKLCSYLTDQFRKSRKSPETSTLVADLVEQSIEADSRDERVSAARKALKLDSACSIAHVVLAREGCLNEAEAEREYLHALPSLKEDVERHARFFPDFAGKNEIPEEIGEDDDPPPYIVHCEAYYLVATEFAQLLWKKHEHDRAIVILSEILEHEQNFCDPDQSYDVLHIADVLILAAAWLCELKRDEEAQRLLLTCSNELPDWHYFNALLRFRQHGDTSLSQGALRHAIECQDEVAHLLLAGSGHEVPFGFEEAFLDDDSLKGEIGLHSLKHCWRSTPGALQWLALRMRGWHLQRPALANFKPTTTDPARVKRWKDNIEGTIKFVKRDDPKNAKRLLKMALRDAEAIEESIYPYLGTVDMLLELRKEWGYQFEDLASSMKRKFAALKQYRFDSDEEKERVKGEFGCAFVALERHDEAALIFASQVEHFEAQMLEDESAVDLNVLSHAFNNYGVCAGWTRNFKEARKSLERSLDLEERYLGSNHPELALNLELLWRACHHEGNHAEEHKVQHRLQNLRGARTMELDWFTEPSSPWYVGKCPLAEAFDDAGSNCDENRYDIMVATIDERLSGRRR